METRAKAKKRRKQEHLQASETANQTMHLKRTDSTSLDTTNLAKGRPTHPVTALSTYSFFHTKIVPVDPMEYKDYPTASGYVHNINQEIRSALKRSKAFLPPPETIQGFLFYLNKQNGDVFNRLCKKPLVKDFTGIVMCGKVTSNPKYHYSIVVNTERYTNWWNNLSNHLESTSEKFLDFPKELSDIFLRCFEEPEVVLSELSAENDSKTLSPKS